MKLLNLTQIFTLVSVYALSLLSAEDTSEPRSQWFQEAKFGMFIHWGLYSQLGGTWNGHTLPAPSLPNGNSPYSEWAQMRLEIPKEEYQKLALTFDPVKFDATAWAREADLAGMRYLVITAKHHDGFALWDSEVSDYDLGITPCKRDLLGELTAACREKGIKVGFYYSHWQDWEHPGGALPPWPNKTQPSAKAFDRYWRDKSLPQVAELLDRYDPDLLWFDTWNNAAKNQISPEKRDELIDLVRSKSDKCLINGRILSHNPGPRIDYLSAGDNVHPEKNLGRPWQTPATMNHSWAWHASDFDWKDSGKMIQLLVQNVSLGGNYLLNIGPYASGEIPAPSIRRLREIGAWLSVHSEAIYGTQPVDGVEPPQWGRLTNRKPKHGNEILYAHIIKWPEKTLSLPSELGLIDSATVLETGEEIKLTETGTGFFKAEGSVHPAVATIRLVMAAPKTRSTGKSGSTP